MQEQTIDQPSITADSARITRPARLPLESSLTTFVHGQRWSPHAHAQAQLMYTLKGVLEVSTPDGTWFVPPTQAIWIPSFVEHSARASGEVALQVVMLELSAATAEMHQAARMVLISPLLRELLRCLARDYAPFAQDELSSHVRALILAELTFLEEHELHLPVLVDRRLRTIQTALHDNPADETALSHWALQLHLSTRSLARLFLKETGATFSVWRQNTRLMLALPRLAAGEPVTRVALDLGYTSPSAFTRMFRRVLGRSPSEYLGTQF